MPENKPPASPLSPAAASFLGEIEKKGADEKRSAETLSRLSSEDAGSVLRELSEAYRRQSRCSRSPRRSAASWVSCR